MGQEPSKFMDLNCIPTGFVLQDPSRMGKTVKELIKHLRERQEHLGVNAFHFKTILGNHDRVEPSKYPLEAQKVISSGEGVQKVTSSPEDTLRTESASMDFKDVDKSKSPAAMSMALGHRTGAVKSPPKSPDISNPSAKDMDGQLISPLSPKILEGEGSNVMKKPPVQHPETRLPRIEHQNPEIFNVREVPSSSSSPHTYNTAELNDNLLVCHPHLPPIPMITAPPAMTPFRLFHYPESVMHPPPESHITQEAMIGNMLPVPQVPFAPSPYPSSHQLSNIDPRLLPSGPIPFLYPNPMFAPTVQPDDPFQVRSTSGHPDYYPNGLPSEMPHMNVDKDSLAAVDGPSGSGRSIMPLPGESSLNISIAAPKGTPVKCSPEKRNQGKRKRNQDQEEPASPLQPKTPVRRRPDRIRKTPKKYTIDC